MESPTIRPIARRAEAAQGLFASVLLHALLVLAFLAPFRLRVPVEREEGVPVEIWSPKEVEALTPPTPPIPEPPASSPDAEAAAPAPEPKPEPKPQERGKIRASKILSGGVLDHPLSRGMRQALAQFDEETRIEQLCGIEAMAQIRATFPTFQPDRVVAYAMADVRLLKGTLVAGGAAFRSERQWYRMSFTCALTADTQTIKTFEFAIGDAIPQRLWEKHNLPAVY